LVGAAELLAYMYDRSLDAFGPHEPPVPLQVYPVRTNMTQPATWSVNETRSQGVYGEHWNVFPEMEGLHSDMLEFPDAYAFGGPGGRHYGYGGMGSGGGMPMRRGRAVMAEGAAMAPQAANMAAPAPVMAESKASRQEMAQAADQSSAKAAPAAPATEVRSNFAETAFFGCSQRQTAVRRSSSACRTR
ncbi:MAG TPA: hypothetical protein VMF89_17810, partial [Polyangiales bacterium]|nr:hypothetical protein [Polyangiales bacterium]